MGTIDNKVKKIGPFDIIKLNKAINKYITDKKYRHIMVSRERVNNQYGYYITLTKS